MVLKRPFRLAPLPDFSCHLKELKTLRDTAWRLIEDAKGSVEAIRLCNVELALAQGAYLSYKQVDLDGGTVIAFYEYVRAMAERDPEAVTYLAAVRRLSDQARANLTQLQRHAHALSRTLD
jgi:hypothetical protein